MKALAKTQAGPGLQLVDRPEPECGADDVRIKVLAAGLCGTDLHLEQWDEWAAREVHPPMTIGHEFFGEIVEVGSDVTSCEVGQKASGEGHVVCGQCRNCRAGRRQMCSNVSSVGVNRDGAFAEYVVIPATNVWVQPADMRPEVGAVFDPLGNATHTTLMFPLVGEDVLITGAGPIGVMAAAIARHAGARHIVVTDVSDYRLDLARDAGADLVLNVAKDDILSAQRRLGMTEGFDVALEMSGNPAALRETIENMNHGGRIALLGLPKESFAIDFGNVITHMLTIKGIYGREMFETWYAASAMMQTSPLLRDTVGSVITHTFPLEEWPQAFEAARSGRCGKVVLDIAGVL
ncbi:L-threonine 3-dehydrogenase [Mobilicoccus pelagius]|uniref:L-threonine 3-dehydrogenase n=1 Tax=Mobilicoccus pelagius NBRC 104925 TaxID=1089455 RepID=H5UV99_9MICO|nr:L-threonine 3-dehydrogenase [Mobilicoccus pelagius]GAB49657.1 L-threonine 3-dehydrogenase [Mobilicoccus pelagius NBRC 104925]